MATKLVCIIMICCYLADVVSGFTPVIYSSKSSTAECGQSDPLQDDQLMAVVSQVQQRLGPPGCNPPRNRSCQEVLHCFPSAPSGYYQIRVPNGSLVQVYCDMEGTNCGGQGGWTEWPMLICSQLVQFMPFKRLTRKGQNDCFLGTNLPHPMGANWGASVKTVLSCQLVARHCQRTYSTENRDTKPIVQRRKFDIQ